MKNKIITDLEGYKKLNDLQYRLACLERNKVNMSFEEYSREYSVLNHKIECHKARMDGKWKKATITYKYEGNG